MTGTSVDSGAGSVLTVPDAPQAFHLLAKPTGAVCNLDCAYCFFLSKEMLYPGSRFRMADDLLDAYVRQLIEAHAGIPEVQVAWQGGEPTMMGVDFFRRSVELADGYFPSAGVGSVPRYDGATLAQGTRIEGPAIIREPTTTVVLYPGSAATVTSLGNYLLEIGDDTRETALVGQDSEEPMIPASTARPETRLH